MKVLFLIMTWCLASYAGLIKTPDKAINDLYPEATAAKKTLLLSSAEAKRVEALSKEKLTSKIVTYYQITTGKTTRYAFMQSVRVRSKNLAALIVVTPEGRIETIEIIAMFEPMEYLPPEKWLQTLEEKSLVDPIRPKRDLPVITGATLSANAVARTARTALAIYETKVRKQ